jgi:hypothetical protein
VVCKNIDEKRVASLHFLPSIVPNAHLYPELFNIRDPEDELLIRVTLHKLSDRRRESRTVSKK